jgi:hypothetical protein
MGDVFASLLELDRRLASADVPPLSPYWRNEAQRFYAHPTARLLVECVGRGGDKSRTSTKMAIAEVLAGSWRIAPGERHYFTHISENRDEAAKTLAVLEQYLRLLRVGFDRAGDTIEIKSHPLGIKVLACRVGAVSGWRCIGWTADECAKYSNEGTDPSAEIIASIRAMTVTHPNARGRMFSSPLGTMGTFHEVWSRGDTAEQVAGHAATWEANPSVTEAQTRALETDARKWAREYAAIPQAGALAAFDAAQIDRAMQLVVPANWQECGRVMLVDPTAGSSDTYAYASAGWRRAPGGSRSVLEIRDVDGVAQAEAQGVTSDTMIVRVAKVAQRADTIIIHSDQFEKFALRAAFTKASFEFYPHTWTAPLKERAVEQVRMWLREGLLALPNHARMRHELLSFEERIAPSGALTFRGRQGGHDDFAMLVMLAALVDIEAGLVGSPSGALAPGQGYLDWIAGEAAAVSSPSPFPAAPLGPEDVTELIAPPQFAGSSQFNAMRGTPYAMRDGRILARPCDVEDLLRIGFARVAV